MNEHDDDLDVQYETPAVIPDDEQEALERCEWHALMIRRYTAELAEHDAMFKREIQRLQDAMELRRARLEQRIEWHTAPIESLHRHRDTQTSKGVATVRFPHGDSKLRTPKTAKVEIMPGMELDAARWFAADHPDLAPVPKIGQVRDLVHVTDDGLVVDATTGERLAFLEVVVPPPTYKFTPTEGAPLA